MAAAMMAAQQTTLVDPRLTNIDALPELSYPGVKPSKKTPLSKKQKKARAASRKARTNRRKNR